MTERYYHGGEDFDLQQMFLRGRRLSLEARVEAFHQRLHAGTAPARALYLRPALTAAGREVEILDPFTGQPKTMLMFGSNNYLGLANDPRVLEAAIKALRRYGIGPAGPPLLNGYSCLHRELERRLSALKQVEDTLVFSSGYGANLGLVSALAGPQDVVFYDQYSHASFCDGLRLAGCKPVQFRHNQMPHLNALLARQVVPEAGTRFVGVEGVYSMDGDLAPLDQLAPLCRQHGARLILDDAHGTGVLGASGAGTAEHFGLAGQVDVTMGTFSKVFGAVGGFLSGAGPLVEYLRFFARSYMFSASLPPAVAAAVLAGLDVLAAEPERRRLLRTNVDYAVQGLRALGFNVATPSAIIALRVPLHMDLRRAAHRFHELGVFVNAVEYPAVPRREQRFRISLMATHTRADLDRLLESVAIVWGEQSDAGGVPCSRGPVLVHVPSEPPKGGTLPEAGPGGASESRGRVCA